MKTCTKCAETKGLSDFHRNSSKPDGYHGECKGCRTEVQSVRKRLYKYKMTAAVYGEMLTRQGHRCAICRRPFPGRITVDHDHSCCPTVPTCGRCNRGLLCDGCNTRLSYVEGNEWTAIARVYLDRYATIRVGN